MRNDVYHCATDHAPVLEVEDEYRAPASLQTYIVGCNRQHAIQTVMPLKPPTSEYGVHGLVSSPYCSMVTTGTYRQAGSVEYLRMLQG